jgi:hypothetical protein
MTRAIFEAETKDDLKYFVALARRQGITVRYSRVLLNTNTAKRPQSKKYNTETLAAMQEARDIISGKIKTKKYKTVEEMNADID